MTLYQIVCILVWFGCTAAVNEIEYGSGFEVFYNETGDYQRYPDRDAAAPIEYFTSELNFDALEGKLLVGAADKLYLLDLELAFLDDFDWVTPSNTSRNCEDADTGYVCRNHIRVYKRMVTDDDLLFVCGTQASVQPQCRTVNISSGEFRIASQPVTASDGVISLNPDLPGFGEFRNSDSSDMTYFTAGFFDGPDGVGRHFSISYQKVNFTDNADPDTLLTTESFRTINANNFWLRFPVTFVDYYRADYAATTASDYQFYYVFLRENLFDDSSPLDVVFTRVVRICRNDPGSMSATNDARHFTTYMKARIFCTRKVPMGSDNVGSIDYVYNNMRSMVFNEDGRYHEDGEWVKMMYGAFTGPLNGPLGSALCVYRADNSFETGGTGDNKGIFDIFREDLQDSDTGTEVQNQFTECNPAGRSDSDAQNQVLIVPNVDQIGEDPLLVFEGLYISQMVLDQVCVVRSQDDTKCLNQDVLFLGTDTGKIMKVVFAGSDPVPVVAEEISLDDDNDDYGMNENAVNDMEMRDLGNGDKYLFVSTRSKVYRIPLERCSRHRSCSECIESRDPYCLWNSTACVKNVLSATGSGEGDVNTMFKQDIVSGDSSACALPVVGFAMQSYTVNENDKSVQLTITSSVAGLGVYVELSTMDGSAKAGVDFEGYKDLEIAFPANEATTTVNITIHDDDNVEDTKSFFAILREVRNVNLGYSMATILITNDDRVPVVGFAVQSYTVNENNKSVQLTITSSVAGLGPGYVELTTLNGSAKAGVNFEGYKDLEIAFPANEATTTVDITIHDDDKVEDTKSFFAILRKVRNVNLGHSVATILITNDDETQPPVSGLSPNDNDDDVSRQDLDAALGVLIPVVIILIIVVIVLAVLLYRNWHFHRVAATTSEGTELEATSTNGQYKKRVEAGIADGDCHTNEA